MEALPKDAAVQVSGCRECLSLLLPRECGRDFTYVTCEKVDAQPGGGAQGEGAKTKGHQGV